MMMVWVRLMVWKWWFFSRGLVVVIWKSGGMIEFKKVEFIAE